MKLILTIVGPPETLEVIEHMFETQFELIRQGECLAKKTTSDGKKETFRIQPIESFTWNMTEE